MAILTLCGKKGGIGKTTIALSLAMEWHRRGVRTLVVDADSDEEDGTALTWASIASELEHDVPTVVAMGDNLRTQLPKLATSYELVIVDTPGGGHRRTIYALGLSDFALLPCGPTGPEIWKMGGIIAKVRDVQAVCPHLEAGIVVTRKQVNTVIGQRAAASLKETDMDVLSTELHYRLSYGEAITGGQGPTTYEPNGAGARETRALADELERKLGLAK